MSQLKMPMVDSHSSTINAMLEDIQGQVKILKATSIILNLLVLALGSNS